MLVLVSGGIAAYAQQDQSTTSSSSSSSSTSVSLAASNTNTTTVTSTVTVTSTSTSSTSTTAANYTLCQPTSVQVGRLVLPITATGSATGSSLSFSNAKGCLASITTAGGIFSVEIALRYAKPVTQYSVVLVANGTSYSLGNMVTGQSASGQMQNQVLLKTGTYVVSIQIYDTSSTPGQSTLVLQTGQGTIVSPPFPAASSNQQGQDGKGQSGDNGHS
jgi:hypothetical protein